MASASAAVIRDAVSTAVREVAQDPYVPGMQGTAINATTDAVVEKVGPIFDHLTNNEDWFRSKVTLGSIAAIVGGVAAIAAEVKAGTWDVQVISAGIGSILGGSFSIYGRWKARKPIGA